MTHYLYKNDQGYPESTDYEILLDIFPGYELIATSDKPFDVVDKVFDEQNKLIKRPRTHTEMRKASYPGIGDQMDMFWHAMNDGTLPKVEPFFSQIKAVKEQYPKT